MDLQFISSLNSSSISYKTIETTQNENYNNEDSKISVCYTKNLLLRSKKNRNYLLVLRKESNIDLSGLSKQLKDQGLRFHPKAVNPSTPLEVVNDEIKTPTFIIEECLKSETDLISFHISQSKNILINVSDLINTLIAIKQDVLYVDITQKIPTVKNDMFPKKEDSQSKQTNAPSKPSTDAIEMSITVSKEDNFSEWYTQVINKGELIDYYDISGCYVIRPSAYFIWEQIHEYLDKKFKKLGVKNCYFPLFVTKARLEAEKTHVEGFSPEVAWVTKSGSSELAEPIAIRPTSETVMYPSYSKWIRSHRDLPLLLNQWNEVVRWEFKQPTPFIRTREFLWQEGHTAHSNEKEAIDLANGILDIYKQVYEELLAVPMIKGFKSDNEKFAGGEITMTIETLITSNGRAIQAATSHYLGQNFAKIFEIEFEDQNKIRKHVYQNSWGLTTRSIGVAIMIHGDNKGLVLPPRVAMIQAVIIPIIFKDKSTKEIMQQCLQIKEELEQAQIRTHFDDRDIYTPGWKYNDWEQKGVPLRIEVGPKDVAQKTARIVERHTGNKSDVSVDNLAQRIQQILNNMHQQLLEKATSNLNDNIVKITCWDEVMPNLNKKKLLLVPWSEDPDSEETIKKATTKSDANENAQESSSSLTAGMKSLCKPFDQPELPENTKCFITGKSAKGWWLFGRSY